MSGFSCAVVLSLYLFMLNLIILVFVVFLSLHGEFGLKYTMVLQISYGVFWIERTEVF
jgi:hypothetical protein